MPQSTIISNARLRKTTSSTHRHLHDDCLEEKVVGHVPIHLSKIFHRFLKLPFCSISAVVIGKRVNRDACDRLEIPVE